MIILVVQLGDRASLLLATPLARCLKKQVHAAELHLLVLHAHAALLAANPYIDKLHSLHFNPHTTIEELHGESFDRVIVLEADAKIRQMLTDGGFPIVASQKGFKTFWQRLLQSAKTSHPAESYLQQASSLRISYDGAGLDYFIPKSAVVPFADLPAAHLAGFISLAVRAPQANPWPAAALQQLVAAIPHPIILIGEAEDRPLAESVRTVDAVKIYNACGKFSLHETADLVRKSKLLIAHNNFFVQTGAALGKPLVWLRNRDAAPFYNHHLLHNETERTYDAVKLPDVWMGKDGTTLCAAATKWVQEVASSVRRRLHANV